GTPIFVPTPPVQVTLAPTTTLLCLGTALNNFADIGESGSDDHLAIKIAWRTVETIFAQSCRSSIGSGLALIKQKLDPNTYYYVGSGETAPATLNFTAPIDIANCTSLPAPSEFYLQMPYWISVVDPDAQQDVVFQTAMDFPATPAGMVAS